MLNVVLEDNINSGMAYFSQKFLLFFVAKLQLIIVVNIGSVA